MPDSKDGKTLPTKIREVITGRKEATIIDLEPIADMFPDHVETT